MNLMKMCVMALMGLFAVSGWGAVDPSLTGPFPSGRLTLGIPGTGGQTLTTDVYFPGTVTDGVALAAGSCPVIVYGHGFSQNKNLYANLGRHLASRGFVVLIPNFGFLASNHARNAEDLRLCLDWITAQHANTNSIFFDRIRLTCFGAAGHSAGGLSAILAAAQDPRIAALSLMDPVDNSGQGVAALANISIPVAMTWSEPSSCNANGSAVTLYNAAQGVKRGIKVVGANHTDPQDPAGLLSIMICGAPNPARQALYRRHLTDWFEYFLLHNHDYLPWVFNYPDGPVAEDITAGRITYSAPLAPLTLSITKNAAEMVVGVKGPVDQRYVLERASRLTDWVHVTTNNLGYPEDVFIDTAPQPLQFFRVRSISPP